MTKWTRKARNAGLSLTAVAAGVLGVEGIASAHDGTRWDHWAVQGTVTSVGANSFTITNHQGTAETIDTTPATTYGESGNPIAQDGVTQGQDVLVALAPPVTLPTVPTTPVPASTLPAPTAPPTIPTPTAVHVTVLLDRVSGRVTDVTSSSITLSGPRGSVREAIISPATDYFQNKTPVSGVTDGQFVTAFGPRDATTPTAIDALFVDIAPTSPRQPRIPAPLPSGTIPVTSVPLGTHIGWHAPPATAVPHGGVPVVTGSGVAPSWSATAPSVKVTVGTHGGGQGGPGEFGGGFSADGAAGHGFSAGGFGSGGNR